MKHLFIVFAFVTFGTFGLLAYQTSRTPGSPTQLESTTSPNFSFPDTKADAPEGCYYQQVECIQAPCDPVLVCGDDSATRPADGVTSPPAQNFTHTAILEDVTKAATIRSTSFATGDIAGIAQAKFEAGEYTMLAEFDELPDPVGDDFYEGWVVRPNPLSVISTGPLTRSETGVYTNSFTTKQNLLDHTRYVLTLEPNDGDPAPADHIVEGNFTSN